jgi:hypothetical protein
MISEEERQRTEPTPLPPGRLALTRRRRILGHLATDPQSGQRGTVVARAGRGPGTSVGEPAASQDLLDHRRLVNQR